MKELYYKMAEHVFILKGSGQDDLLHQLGQYEPFVIEPAAEVSFCVEIVEELPVSNIQEELRQEDEGQAIVAGHLDGGEAYMFLGHSGTGKSAHSSLWLKYIEGTELVNDDNPVVRIIDGVARVYGL